MLTPGATSRSKVGPIFQSSLGDLQFSIYNCQLSIINLSISRMPRVRARPKRPWKSALFLATILGSSWIAPAAAPLLDSSSLDPAFESHLAAVRKATGFTEGVSDQQTAVKDLRLLIGIKSVDGTKRSLYFVELTKMHASQAGSLSTAYTNRINWPGTGSPPQTNTVFEF